MVDFIRNAGEKAEYVTSVCTGSLILAEAGLLDGYKAATHWGYRDVLKSYPGITHIDERVVIDRNRITGGGITAGLDFALTVIAEVIGEQAAHAMQLVFEYRPQPPFKFWRTGNSPTRGGSSSGRHDWQHRWRLASFCQSKVSLKYWGEREVLSLTRVIAETYFDLSL